jgi:uncharacterized membrane protein HdeD (DUF308 family)
MTFTEVEPDRPSTIPWWSITLRGILAIVFGVIVLANPRIGALALVIVFGVYAALDGVAALVVATHLGRAAMRWGWWLVEGLVGLAIAVLAFLRPGATLLAIVLLVAIRAFAVGLLEIVSAVGGWAPDHRWPLGLAGALSVLFGVLLMAEPVVGGLALVWAIGAYSVVSGIVLGAAGLRAWSQSHATFRRRAHAT